MPGIAEVNSEKNLYAGATVLDHIDGAGRDFEPSNSLIDYAREPQTGTGKPFGEHS